MPFPDQRASDAFAAMEEQAKLQASFRRVFENPDGEEVLRHIMRAAGIGVTSFTPGDPHVTAFKEGQKHIVLSLIRLLGRDDLMLIMETMQMRSRQNEEQNPAGS